MWTGERSSTSSVDAPPGTSDENITLTQYMQETEGVGAIIVTTPQVFPPSSCCPRFLRTGSFAASTRFGLSEGFLALIMLRCFLRLPPS